MYAYIYLIVLLQHQTHQMICAIEVVVDKQPTSPFLYTHTIWIFIILIVWPTCSGWRRNSILPLLTSIVYKIWNEKLRENQSSFECKQFCIDSPWETYWKKWQWQRIGASRKRKLLKRLTLNVFIAIKLLKILDSTKTLIKHVGICKIFGLEVNFRVSCCLFCQNKIIFI